MSSTRVSPEKTQVPKPKKSPEKPQVLSPNLFSVLSNLEGDQNASQLEIMELNARIGSEILNNSYGDSAGGVNPPQQSL